MALFTDSLVRQRAQKAKSMKFVANARDILLESVRKQSSRIGSYDIFLSHSSKDADIILGLKGVFEDLGHSVYVDWIDDRQLDRGNVTKETAEILKNRMRLSKTLFYVTTGNAVNSKWMPWECGFFDGLKSKVAIVPVVQHSTDNHYAGQEYLGIYPYIVKEGNKSGGENLWVQKDYRTYTSYKTWSDTPDNQIAWKND